MSGTWSGEGAGDHPEGVSDRAWLCSRPSSLQPEASGLGGEGTTRCALGTGLPEFGDACQAVNGCDLVPYGPTPAEQKPCSVHPEGSITSHPENCHAAWAQQAK